MNEVLHLSVTQEPSGSFRVTTNYGQLQGSEVVTFAPSAQYQQAKKNLLDRIPGSGLLSLSSQKPVCVLIGEELFNTFITGTVLACYRDYRRKNDPPRLALHLSRGLYREPWELLRDLEDDQQGDFLCLIGSVVRCDAQSGGPDPRNFLIPPRRALRCLFVSPQVTPNLGEDAVPPFDPEGQENLQFDVVTPPTYDDFVKVTLNQNPDGFIFYGHGRVQDSVGHLVFVILQGIPFFRTRVNDLRKASMISDPLASKKNLCFGLLLACETAWMSDDPKQRMNFEDTVTGSLLTSTKIGFVVGAQLKIDFFAAQRFLSGTLNALRDGTPLDLALRTGRTLVRNMDTAASLRSPLDWWVPVLYAKSTVFDILARPPVAIPE